MKTMKIALFEGKKIRRTWYKEKWWFVIIDVVAVLTDSIQPDGYIKDMRRRDPQLSEGWRQIATPLSIQTEGGPQKMNCANTEGILRIIQSIPSPKAEPFKLWLARVGKERIDEIENPELAVNRAKSIYEKKGYSKDWIDKRLRGIAVRHGLTDEWCDRGVKNKKDYAILTNEIMQGAFDMKVNKYKKFKRLDRQNLRDHMIDLEIILTMLGEATTTEITKVHDSKGFEKLDKDAKNGGAVAGRTRKDIEKQTGKRVCSKENYLKHPQNKKLIDNGV